jgi:hypothetical protein
MPRDPPNLRGMVMKDRANVLVEMRSPNAYEYIERARLSFAKVKNERELMFLEMLEATRACDQGQLETVERIVARLVPSLLAQGERRRLARVRCILGVALMDHGRIEDAVHPLTEALDAAHAVADSGTAGQAACYLAQCALESGRLSNVIDYALAATEDFAHFGDPAWLAQAWVLLASAYMAGGDDTLGAQALQTSARFVRKAKPSVRRTVLLEQLRVLGEVLRGRSGNASFGIASEEERASGRMLRAVLKHRTSSGLHRVRGAIRIRRDGHCAWDAKGQKMSLQKFPVLQTILRLLILGHESTPGRPISTQAIIAAAWPAERLLPSAAKNRLYVAIRRLRVLGLESVIEVAPWWLFARCRRRDRGRVVSLLVHP